MEFNLNIGQVVNDMLQAALPYLSNGGQKASSYAAHEFQQYITNIEHVPKIWLKKEK